MELTSPGYRSQLIFTGFDGAHFDRGDHWALHSLTNPNYFWGNLLIFDRPPQKGDYARWSAAFAKEFTNPAIYHRTFAWQGDLGDISEFNNFRLETTVALTATTPTEPPRLNSDLEIRPITADEWPEMIEVSMTTSEPHLSEAAWRDFHTKQALRYQAMKRAGLGHWWGGFHKGKLVTGLGLYTANGISRFQNVATHAAHQRQGFCQTLVYEVTKRTPHTLKVMCADPSYHAIKIYESCGFQRTATEHGVSWFDPARA